MVSHHYRKTHKRYDAYPKTDSCDFCDTDVLKKQVVYETEHAFVVPNRTFYDVWELHDVLDHLLIVPKRHVHTLSELNDEELLNISKLMAKYDGEEYNIYARGKDSPRRSVHHQHTHLIKIDRKSPKFSVYLRKPHLLVKF